MAKKTKQQKIAAEERREKFEYSLPDFSKRTAPSTKTADTSSNYAYVIFDLKKIGLFTLLAFGAEIILWYFLR